MDELDIFRAEAEGLVDSLEAALLALRDTPQDLELINKVFRDLHTLKGSGSMFGRDDIASFLHDFETAFEKVRDGSVLLDSPLIAISLEASDHVASLLKGGDIAPGADLIARLAAILSGEPQSTGSDAAEPVVMAVNAPEPEGGAEPDRTGGQIAAWDVGEPEGDLTAPEQAGTDTGDAPRRFRFWMARDTLVLGGRPDLILRELRELGASAIRPLLDDLPDLSDMDPTQLYIGWEAEIGAEVEEDDIRSVFLFHEDGLRIEIDPSDAASCQDAARPEAAAPAQAVPAEPVEYIRTRADTSAAPPSVFANQSGDVNRATPSASAAQKHRPADAGGTTAGATEAAAPAKASQLMRVPAERLDDMMNRVGELVIAEARLLELARNSGDPNLVAVAEDIQRLTTAMRDTTMSIRMTPIGAITGRFKRLIHDLSVKLGKGIDFSTHGEETELDKTVVEQLTDPLMHIIRNAVDHGLERPEERHAMGKPTQGHVRLTARYSGAEVLISLSDDGRGLDRAAILRRARDRGLVPDGVEPSDEEVNGLIFEPGFSTAAEVTELSGRGVGMDVVKRTIEALRGSLEVSTEPGHGTTVTLRLPLTLAIIDGLLIEVGGERFVIPLAAVTEIVELPALLARESGSNAFLDIRESLVPFIRLRRLLSSTGTPDPHQKVIVVTSGEGRVGLVVDRIIGSNQTVIKQLSPLHAGLKEFSGATILGDGSVAMILDVPQLVLRGRALADAGREAA